MMQMNNPMMMLFNAMRRGQNPSAVLRQMLGNDPRIAYAEQMMRGKSPQQLEMVVRNMAKERGLDLDAMMRQYTNFR